MAAQENWMKRTIAFLGTILLTTLAAQADTLVTVRPVGTDSAVWSQLGANGSTINNPFSFTTTNGVAGTGSYAINGTGEVLVQSAGWSGNFTPGEYLNWNTGNGAITLNFSQGFGQVGAQIETDAFGPFTAQICDVNACFTEDGTSSDFGDGSAIYLGISSGTPINSVTFSILSGGNVNDFAINQVTLNGASVPSNVTPEPSSFVLLGTGVAGMIGAARRKLARR
jgi:hypothetical protein